MGIRQTIFITREEAIEKGVEVYNKKNKTDIEDIMKNKTDTELEEFLEEDFYTYSIERV